MTARPVLGIICCNRMVGTESAQAVMDRYVRAAMFHADVAALLIPSLPDLMTAAEVQFSLAEAKQRFSGVTLAGTASAYYAAGVTESFRASGANVSYATDLLNSGKDNADFTASTNKLNAIAYQKWVALGYFSGLEAWTEYRKSNYPVTPQSKNYLGVERPLRLYYPGSELGSNGANVNAQGTIDPLKTKIFWDID